MKTFDLNSKQPIPLDPKYLPWQIIDKDNNLICEFRGSMSMMCCMAALQQMNDPSYTMSSAVDIYQDYNSFSMDEER